MQKHGKNPAVDSGMLCNTTAVLPLLPRHLARVKHLSSFFLSSAMARFTRSLSASCSFFRRTMASSRPFSSAASFSCSAATWLACVASMAATST